MEEKVLTNKGLKENVEEINYPSEKIEETKETIQEVSKYEEKPKTKRQEKKEEIKGFNNNPETKKYGVKLVSKTAYAGIWIFAIVLLLLFFVNIVWGNSALSKLADKDFNINVDTGQVVINNSNENYYEHDIVNNNYNNYTIINNNTVIFPEELLIKLSNSS